MLKTVLFLCALLILINLTPINESYAVTPPQSGSKINWQGKLWNVTGVNVPWYNWGCDFGCNNSGGVMQTRTAIAPKFQDLRTSGMHTVRWWIFPGDPWQINRDGSGMPTGINPAVYADIDAALQLAETYDLYYNFVIFSAATAPPRSWLDNPTHRAALSQALGTMFARYKDNPRIMTWEVFNEPEFQIWNSEISEASVVATGRSIADSVHANSDALVTVGHAFADAIPMWTNANLDYYSPHWYDYMSGTGDWCMRCNDYNYYRNKYGITKPIVVGEIYLGNNNSDDLARFNEFYNKGYAGIWGWSLFADRTSDLLTVNLTAAQTFTSGKSDIGPASTGASPTPTPTPTPTLSPSPSASLAPSVPPASASPAPIPGDIDGIGGVDIFDYTIVLTNFGRSGSNIPGDIDGIGGVDIFDYTIVLTNFGK